MLPVAAGLGVVNSWVTVVLVDELVQSMKRKRKDLLVLPCRQLAIGTGRQLH